MPRLERWRRRAAWPSGFSIGPPCPWNAIVCSHSLMRLNSPLVSVPLSVNVAPWPSPIELAASSSRHHPQQGSFRSIFRNGGRPESGARRLTSSGHRSRVESYFRRSPRSRPELPSIGQTPRGRPGEPSNRRCALRRPAATGLRPAASCCYRGSFLTVGAGIGRANAQGEPPASAQRDRDRRGRCLFP
jgi:hypothetical protein